MKIKHGMYRKSCHKCNIFENRSDITVKKLLRISIYLNCSIFKTIDVLKVAIIKLKQRY